MIAISVTIERVQRKEFTKRFGKKSLGLNNDYYYIVNGAVGVIMCKEDKEVAYTSDGSEKGAEMMGLVAVEMLNPTDKYDRLLVKADLEFMGKELSRIMSRGSWLIPLYSIACTLITLTLIVMAVKVIKILAL